MTDLPRTGRNAQGVFDVNGPIESIKHLEYLAEHDPKWLAVAKQAAIQLGGDAQHGDSFAYAMAELHKQVTPLTPTPRDDVLAVINTLAQQAGLLPASS